MDLSEIYKLNDESIWGEISHLFTSPCTSSVWPEKLSKENYSGIQAGKMLLPVWHEMPELILQLLQHALYFTFLGLSKGTQAC